MIALFEQALKHNQWLRALDQQHKFNGLRGAAASAWKIEWDYTKTRVAIHWVAEFVFPPHDARFDVKSQFEVLRGEWKWVQNTFTEGAVAKVSEEREQLRKKAVSKESFEWHLKGLPPPEPPKCKMCANMGVYCPHNR